MAISTPGHPTAQVRQVSLPAGSRALSTLARIDYADAFTTRPGAGRARDRTGEQWARAVRAAECSAGNRTIVSACR